MDSTQAPTRFKDRPKDEVLRLVHSRPGLSRAQLSDLTGLSRSAIARVVGELLHDGHLHVNTVVAPGKGAGSGRPAHTLFASTPKSVVMGLDFGHRHIRVAAAYTTGEEIGHLQRLLNVDLNWDAAVDAAVAMVEDLRNTYALTDITAVVAGIPGPIDSDMGIVRSPTILSGWVGKTPARELEQRLGLPVVVDNDAVLGAYGEHAVGAGRGHDNLIYVKISDGIGAALILNGQVYRGSIGLAGEVGHTRLDSGTELCRCGRRGCLEAEVSTDTIARHLRYAHPTLNDDRFPPEPLNDEVASRIFFDAGLTVGRVLSDMCNLLNPSAVIIGGRLGVAHPAVVAGVRSAIDNYSLAATANNVEVLAAQFGCEAEVTGAIAFARKVAIAPNLHA